MLYIFGSIFSVYIMRRLRERIFEEIIQQSENRLLEDQPNDLVDAADEEIDKASSTEDDGEEMDVDGGEVESADVEHTPILNVIPRWAAVVFVRFNCAVTRTSEKSCCVQVSSLQYFFCCYLA